MILFAAALPFALYGIGYGFYCLGCSLARWAPGLWLKLRRKGGGGR